MHSIDYQLTSLPLAYVVATEVLTTFSTIYNLLSARLPNEMFK